MIIKCATEEASILRTFHIIVASCAIPDCYEKKPSNMKYNLITAGRNTVGYFPTMLRNGDLGWGPDPNIVMTVSFPDGHRNLIKGRCKRIKFTLTNSGRMFDTIVVKNLAHGKRKFVTWCGLYITKVSL